MSQSGSSLFTGNGVGPVLVLAGISRRQGGATEKTRSKY
jgi:hypothetical protein